jgi:hypothetical protein
MRVKKHRNLTAEAQSSQRKTQDSTVRAQLSFFLCELGVSAVSLGSQVSR